MAHGARIIDADQITRELQRSGSPVFEAMVERFGEHIIGVDGELDRAAVADIVFTDAVALADLNAIVHPAVGAEIARQVQEAGTTDDVVVLDVPLLVETGRDDLAALLVVDVDPDLAVQRLVEHRGFTQEQARLRIAAQADRAQRLARADVVIDNSGDLQQLAAHVDAAWEWLEALRDQNPA